MIGARMTLSVVLCIVWMFGFCWLCARIEDRYNIVMSWAGFPAIMLAILLWAGGTFLIVHLSWPFSETATSIRMVADKQTHTITTMILVGKVMVPQQQTIYTFTSADGATCSVDEATYLARKVGEMEACQWR